MTVRFRWCASRRIGRAAIMNHHIPEQKFGLVGDDVVAVLGEPQGIGDG